MQLSSPSSFRTLPSAPKIPLCLFIAGSCFYPQTWTTPDLLSGSIVLPFLEISHTWDHTVWFCVWLFSLSLMFLRFIYVLVFVLHPSLWLNNILLYGYTTFVYSFITYGHLDCFQFMAVMNNAMNIHVLVFVWTYVFISLG